MLDAIPTWALWLGGLVLWVGVGLVVAIWVGGWFRRRREVEDFAEWARSLHDEDQRSGLSIEIGDGYIRITSPDEERVIETAPGTGVEIALGAINRDPKKDLH